MSDRELRLNVAETPRSEWPDRFRRVVELFEATEDLASFESDDHYPLNDDPYVLHTDYRAPLWPDADTEYSWHILLNPWSSPSKREAFVVDGSPLRPENTAHGAGPDDYVASEDDLVDVYANRVVVGVALTKLAEFHSRAGNWIHGDSQIETQFDNVLDALEADAGLADDCEADNEEAIN